MDKEGIINMLEDMLRVERKCIDLVELYANETTPQKAQAERDYLSKRAQALIVAIELVRVHL